MALRKILQADIVRMQATKPENTSLAAAYFKNRPMHNSTHISASRIKAEGAVPKVWGSPTYFKDKRISL